MEISLERIKAIAAGRARQEKVERSALNAIREAAKELGYTLVASNGSDTRSFHDMLVSAPEVMPKPTPESKGLGCPWCEKVAVKRIHLGRHISVAHPKKFKAWQTAR